MLLRSPPPPYEMQFHLGVVGQGNLVDVERELGESENPGFALIAGAAAVVIGAGVDCGKLHACFGQVGKQVGVVSQDRRARAGLVGSDELALDARSPLGQPLRLELVSIHVVGGDDEVGRKPERLRGAEVHTLKVPECVAEAVLRVA